MLISKIFQEEQIKTKVKKVKTVNLVNGLAHGLLRTPTALIPNNTELLLDSREQLLDLLYSERSRQRTLERERERETVCENQ